MKSSEDVSHTEGADLRDLLDCRIDGIVRMVTSPDSFWKQVSRAYTEAVNDGSAVSLPVFLEQLANTLRVHSAELQICPKVPALNAGDYVCVSELRFTGDFDLLRAAAKAS